MPDLSAVRFTASHEWARVDGETARIGITDFAQAQLGDVIFVELAEPGTALQAGAKFGSIESVKAASDLFAPVGGTVVEVNSAITAKPELVNSDPYGEGWLIRLEGVTAGGAELLDEAAYNRLTGAA